MYKIVVFGGGTGLSILSESLRKLNAEFSIVVATSDNGGSTGKIRKAYDIPAPGDIRRVALAFSDNKDMKKLMNYRFDENLENHTIGNLILASLIELEGTMGKAVAKYCQILGVKTKIYPITNDSLNLKAVMKNKSIISGEKEIVKYPSQIKEIFYDNKKTKSSLELISAIEKADLIIYSCGSLYTSLLPNLIVSNIKTALKKTKAPKVYVSNIMTQVGETDDYMLSDHIKAIKKHTFDNIIDIVISNNNYEIVEDIKQKYLDENSEIVKIDKIENSIELIQDNYIIIDKYIRHDHEKIKDTIDTILKRS